MKFQTVLTKKRVDGEEMYGEAITGEMERILLCWADVQ
jgi:hypothetical protein